jgi:hypothetical protein
LRRTQEEAICPIPYPDNDPNPTPKERAACRFIIAAREAVRGLDHAHFLREKRYQRMAEELMLYATRKCSFLLRMCREIYPVFEAHFQVGKDLFEARIAANPDVPESSLLPVPLDPETPVPIAMDYVCFAPIDPLCDPEPNPCEQRLWYALGAIAVAERELLNFADRHVAGDLMAPILYYQMKAMIDHLDFHIGGTCYRFRDGAAEAEKDEAAGRSRIQRIEAQRIEMQSRIIFLNDLQVPRYSTKIGTTLDKMHQLAVSLDVGGSLLIIGGTGSGKTTFSYTIAEGVSIAQAELTAPPPGAFPIFFGVDYTKGYTRIQPIAGLDPNPSRDQLQSLYDVFGARIAPSNACYPKIRIRTLPGMAEVMRKKFPDSMGGRLDLRDFYIGYDEWCSPAARALFGAAAERNGHKTQLVQLIDNIVSTYSHGKTLNPDQLEEKIHAAKLTSSTGKALLLSCVEFMRRVSSPIKGLRDETNDTSPLYFLLAAPWGGPDQILPLELAIIHYFNSQATDDSLLAYFFGEFAKQGASPAMQRQIDESTREGRHGKRIQVMDTHLSSDFDDDIIANASGLVLMNGVSEKDLDRMARLNSMVRGIGPKDLNLLQTAEAIGFFRRTTDPAFMQKPIKFKVRPTMINAGGETIRVG